MKKILKSKSGKIAFTSEFLKLSEKFEKVEKEIYKGALNNLKELDKDFPWYMKYGSSIYLTGEHKKILESFESEDEFNTYFMDKFRFEVLNSTSKISIADAAEMLREDDIEYNEPLECGIGYREINGELILDHLAVFDGRSPLTKFKMAIMKEFEPLVFWCLDQLLFLINEVKDAFPFFCADQVAKVKESMKPKQEKRVWLTKDDGRTNNIDTSEFSPGDDLFVDPDRPGYLISPNCRCALEPPTFDDIEPLGRCHLEPFNLMPFFKAVAIIVGLLILSGLAHYCGYALP